jgi:hypothetical protein
MFETIQISVVGEIAISLIVLNLVFLSFEIVSNFVLRISDFRPHSFNC